MIRMVKAGDLQLGMKISTDGLIIGKIEYHVFPEMIAVGGICHGIWKEENFNPEDELPIYYDDTNTGED